MSRHIVGRVEELPPGSVRIVPLGRYGIGVFNVRGTYYALHNYCPHFGAPICLGDVSGTTESEGPYHLRWVRDGEILRCPWHGWEVDIASGKTVTAPTKAVKTYPVLVEDGLVILEA